VSIASAQSASSSSMLPSGRRIRDQPQHQALERRQTGQRGLSRAGERVRCAGRGGRRHVSCRSVVRDGQDSEHWRAPAGWASFAGRRMHCRPLRSTIVS
jgi:hypothetical protein